MYFFSCFNHGFKVLCFKLKVLGQTTSKTSFDTLLLGGLCSLCSPAPCYIHISWETVWSSLSASLLRMCFPQMQNLRPSLILCPQYLKHLYNSIHTAFKEQFIRIQISLGQHLLNICYSINAQVKSVTQKGVDTEHKEPEVHHTLNSKESLVGPRSLYVLFNLPFFKCRLKMAYICNVYFKNV